jgi:spore coat polysaccharide biosynthesis protein SpsF (cytidylyltransferase family)/aryl-alcohol dehydrogenase-like predicted oxidoreductase
LTGIAVLQARTGSTRLPAKALLPVAGLPMVVLAALRAANTGRRVVVVTSTSPADDALAAALAEHALPFFRGSLDDVLDRVVQSLDGLADDTIVVRLTADNVFPDGVLLDEIEQDFVQRGLEYLACNGMESGVPYGLSAEVTRLRHLREAARVTDARHDREHVTPFVIRRFGARWFERYRGLKRGLDRCTIDSLDDYRRVLRALDGEPDPVHVPWSELVRRLARLPDAPIAVEPVHRLVVGGAQLGMRYGIANAGPAPDLAECEAIVKTAVANGVVWIDTARAYGSSEENIGAVLSRGWAGRIQVATKLSPLHDVPPDASGDRVAAEVDASIWRSRAALRGAAPDALLLHRCAHLDAWDGAAWRRLLRLRADGVVRTLGVSVQSPDELLRALREPDVAWVQLPFNILDTRWGEAIPAVSRARAERGLIVHARSPLLQGLLASNDPAHWRQANVADPDATREWLQAWTTRLGRRNVVDLCLAYVRSQGWIDGVVVGMERIEQVVENIGYFGSAPIGAAELLAIGASVPVQAEQTLDPARWQRRAA